MTIGQIASASLVTFFVAMVIGFVIKKVINSITNFTKD